MPYRVTDDCAIAAEDAAKAATAITLALIVLDFISISGTESSFGMIDLLLRGGE
jgi:hypothetical protein